MKVLLGDSALRGRLKERPVYILKVVRWEFTLVGLGLVKVT
jgi:hypothetical protein